MSKILIEKKSFKKVLFSYYWGQNVISPSPLKHQKNNQSRNHIDVKLQFD